MKRFIEPLNAPKMRLVAGFRPDPLVELAVAALPQTLAELKGRELETGGGRGDETWKRK